MTPEEKPIERESKEWRELGECLDAIYKNVDEAIHKKGFCGEKYQNVRRCLIRIRKAADSGIKIIPAKTKTRPARASLERKEKYGKE